MTPEQLLTGKGIDGDYEETNRENKKAIIKVHGCIKANRRVGKAGVIELC